MQVNKVNLQSFNGVTLIKSKHSKYINLLNDVDFFILKKSVTPTVRFDSVATSSKQNGYWTGKLLDGQDIFSPYKAIDKNAPEQEINSTQDILNLPQLKIFAQQISQFFKEINV